jgi:CDGSH-type Zn-finger protein
MSEARIDITKDGPLMVNGLKHFRNSRDEPIAVRESMYLCRCGGSKNKPFCDGTHTKIGFKDDKN